MKNTFKLIALLAIIVSFAACKSSDDPFTPGEDNLGIANKVNSNISFTAKIDGEDFEAAEVTAVQSDGGSGSNPNFDVRQFTIKGENAAGDVIQFVLQRNTAEAFGEGIYEVGHVPTGSDDYTVTFLYAGTKGSFQTFPTMSTGTIEITKISGTQIEGAFSAKLFDGAGGQELNITEGGFKSNKYGTFY